jgi:hypothetical protein
MASGATDAAPIRARDSNRDALLSQRTTRIYLTSMRTVNRAATRALAFADPH